MIRTERVTLCYPLSWLLSCKRMNRIGKFEPVPSARESHIAYTKRMQKRNKHTTGIS